MVRSIPISLTKHIFKTVLILLLFAPFAVLQGTEISFNNCEAQFLFEPYDGNPSTSGINFYDVSGGDYDFVSWDFGDGAYSSGHVSVASSATHFYDDYGFYTVSLTVWDSAGICMDQYTEEIFVGEDEFMCDYTDCVFPGDANGDGKADFYDVLNIGVGIGHSGPTRPDSTLSWVGQPAPDWDYTTVNGVNYKHIDCNGDGIIDEGDLEAIHYNYASMYSPVNNSEWDGALVKLDFPDTIEYESVSDLSGGIYLGAQDKMFEDLYAIAFYIEYDPTFFDNQYPEFTSSYESSFLGEVNQDLRFEFKDRRPDGQMDFALARMGAQAVDGYGKVASLNFIIIDDVIGSKIKPDEPNVSVEFEIKGVKAINKNGEELLIRLESEPEKVVFTSQTTNVENIFGNQIEIFPNPTSGFTQINLGDLDITDAQIKLYNAIGAKVYEQDVLNQTIPLHLADLPKGLYTLHFESPQGIGTKKIVIK